MNFKFSAILLLSTILSVTAIAQSKISIGKFQHPDPEFRPMPFWHNGQMTDTVNEWLMKEKESEQHSVHRSGRRL
jgi:hypothetical protein